MSVEPSLKWHSPFIKLRWNNFPSQWERGILGCFAGLLTCVSLFFAWRRAVGAFISPLSSGLMISSGLFLVLITVGVRFLWRKAVDRKISLRTDLLFDLFLSASVLIFAVSTYMPGSNPWVIGFLGLSFLTEEVWAWRPRVEPLIFLLQNKRTFQQPAQVDIPKHSAPHHKPSHADLKIISDFPASSNFPDDGVTQQLIRSTTADGSETLAGWLRLHFATGQRIGNMHVAFCPPFVRTPELTISQIDGPEARIKIAQLLPYGARLDLKLITMSDEPASVLLQFIAHAAVETTE